MKTKRFFSFRCLIGVTPVLLCAGLSAAPLTWFPGTDLSEPRSSAATVVNTAGNIMTFGGNPVGSVNVLVYGGSNVQPLNSTRVAPGAVALATGQYFVYGGRTTNTAKSASSTTYSYNPISAGADAENPSIFTVASMITQRSDMGYAADAAGHAYAIGGLGRNTNALATVERYDPLANVWTNAAALPAARFRFGAVFDGTNLIYTFGGRTNGTTGAETATVLSYDVGANAWSTLTPMPVATAGSAAVKGSDGKYYVIGGTSGGSVTSLVQVFDPGSGTWSLATPLPVAVTGAGAAVDTLGRIVVMGGADGSGTDLSAGWVSQQLNLPDAAPVFTTTPPLTANCTLPYSYTNRASGNPQPVFQLLTAPAGMQLDPYSGVVTWTPDVSEFGSNTVSVVAGNYAGSVTQTFVINTVGPPLAPPVNLVETAVADNSVTISWDPPAFLIGPLTYQLYVRTVYHDPRGSGGGYHYGLLASGFTANSVTISGLAAGSSHTYVVKASAAGVTSGYSAAIGIVTTVPQPPQNLRVTGITSTTVSLAWDPSPSPGIVSYEVYGWLSDQITSASYASGLTGTTVTISGLTPGSVHSWGVRAWDSQGNASGFDYGNQVYNPAPTPATLTSFAPTSGGGFQFIVQSDAVQTTLIQATSTPTDPLTWVTIATNPPSSTSYSFTDPNAGLYPARFYRVVSP